MSESVEVTSKLCDEVSGVGSIGFRSESMIDVKPELCGGMSANFDGVAEPGVKESEPVVSKDSKSMEDGTGSVACPTMNLDESELKKTDVGLVGLEKVGLTVDDDDEKGETSSSESESETSSSSASSSSEEEDESDEEDSEEEKKFEDQMVMGKENDMAGELEEGEIQSVDEEHEFEDDDDEVDEMVAWSYDEDEDLGWQTKEPIRTKNELKVPILQHFTFHDHSF